MFFCEKLLLIILVFFLRLFRAGDSFVGLDAEVLEFLLIRVHETVCMCDSERSLTSLILSIIYDIIAQQIIEISRDVIDVELSRWLKNRDICALSGPCSSTVRAQLIEILSIIGGPVLSLRHRLKRDFGEWINYTTACLRSWSYRKYSYLASIKQDERTCNHFWS